MKKYMHASLGSHPKTTLIAAANEGYLNGCPGMTVPSISKFIAIEDATEMGHMKQIQQGARSTSRKSNRGRPSQQAPAVSPRTLAMDDALSTPEQSPGTQPRVYMAVEKAEGFVSSD